jgi:hypothetical protein
VTSVLGILGLIVFIASVIGLAAGVTWLVVKASPDPNRKKKKGAESAPEA